MSMGTGTLDGFLASIGGFGTHTNITLFLPTLGIESYQIRSDQIESRFRKVLLVPLNREKHY